MIFFIIYYVITFFITLFYCISVDAKHKKDTGKLYFNNYDRPPGVVFALVGFVFVWFIMYDTCVDLLAKKFK